MRLYTHVLHDLGMSSADEWNGSVFITQHVGLKDRSVLVAFFWQLAKKYFHVLIQFEINVLI